MADILKGKEAADRLTEQLQKQAACLRESNITPQLAVIRIGDRADDIAYERGLTKRAENTGVNVKKYVLDKNSSEADLINIIDTLNEDDDTHGILLLRPLPSHMDENTVRNRLAPCKDIDGITDISMAGVFTGGEQGYSPCTAEACIRLLEHYGIEIKGRNAVILGRSQVIGKPVAMMMLKKDATVTICHTKTVDTAAVCKTADILIACAGVPEMVTHGYFNEKQVIIDVGINFDKNGKMCGDVDFKEAETSVRAISPVPGGVGAVTTTVLMEHVIKAAEKAGKEREKRNG